MVAFIACGCGAPGAARDRASQEARSDPLAAVAPPAPGDFLKLHATIKPRSGEERFLEIPWLLDLWEARRRAASEGRPILAFLMSGHPLGCT